MEKNFKQCMKWTCVQCTWISLNLTCDLLVFRGIGAPLFKAQAGPLSVKIWLSMILSSDFADTE